MIKQYFISAFVLNMFLGLALTHAHFQVLIPSTDIVESPAQAMIDLDIRFTHPMEQGPVMNMDQPAQFGVMVGGEKLDLIHSLKPYEINNATAYNASCKIKQPGDHIFYIEPAPYWEPAEEKMIIHYTKVCVSAFGDESGWDQLVGFPVEIKPLTRPYGLWTGNTFQGIVLKHGRPVPFAEIEVEYNNTDNIDIPAGPFTTQVIKADADGTFTYTIPYPGWWAFAALIDGDNKINNPDNKPSDVELGALIWIHTVNMK